MNTNFIFNSRFFSSPDLHSLISTVDSIYPFIHISSIGKSVLGTDISCIHIGSGEKKVLFFSSIHANELITTNVLMQFLLDICSNFSDFKNTFSNITLYILPLVNPDGADLFLDIIPHNSTSYINCVDISKKYSNIPFPSGWKSNISGVDLNLQFPALWNSAKSIKHSKGYTCFSPRDYVGIHPLSEPESKALYDFSVFSNFDLALCLHTQGEEIYYEFQGNYSSTTLEIGSLFSTSSGYPLKTVPHNSSFAGYKDWFISKYNKPCFTIEMGLRRKPSRYFSFLQYLC